jgi:hypothetical protein
MEAGPVRPGAERTAGDLVTTDPVTHPAGPTPATGRWRVSVDAT